MSKATETRPNAAALTTDDPALVGWWITDDFLWRNGRRIMGPFATQDLAMQVRTLRETVEGHARYFVDEIKAAEAS